MLKQLVDRQMQIWNTRLTAATVQACPGDSLHQPRGRHYICDCRVPANLVDQGPFCVSSQSTCSYSDSRMLSHSSRLAEINHASRM